MQRFVVWTFDAQRYALPLFSVDRVVCAVQAAPLPAAPDIVRGIINVQGELVPVVDMRQRLGLPPREAVPADRIVIARSARRKVAFFIDAIGGVVDYPDDRIVPAVRITPGARRIAGVVMLDDGMILIDDLDRLLSLEEEAVLDEALFHAD